MTAKSAAVTFERVWKWVARQVKELLPYAPIH
jgi:hypothetical protein